MGGFGSGYQRQPKRLIESCLSLSVADLGILPGVASSPEIIRLEPSGSTIAVTVDAGLADGAVGLSYASDGHPVDYHVDLTTTPMPDGIGCRFWFCCPILIDGQQCGRRVGKLYLPPGAKYFGCRHCHDLTYSSCQLSHNRGLEEIAADLGISVRGVREYFGRKRLVC